MGSQVDFATAVGAALASDQPVSILAYDNIFMSEDWDLPGNASSLSITFDTSPFVIGTAEGDAALTLRDGASITVTAGRIDIGDGGTGTLTIAGGSVTLSGSSYLNIATGTGTLNLDGGTLSVGGTNGIRGAGAFNFGDGTLIVTSALTTSNAITLQSGTGAEIDTNGFTATLSGAISGSGALNKSGTGTLILSGTNTYTGGTHVTAGTLSVESAGALAEATSLFVEAGATFNLATPLLIIGSLSGSGEITTNTNALVVGVDDADSVFSGVITNGGNGWDSSYGTFTKTGTGTLLLDGASILGGETYVQAGAIAVEYGASTVDYLAVGTGTGNSGALAISGGTLNVGVALQVGDWGGTGTVNQTGGTLNVSPTCESIANCASLNIGNQGGTGTYNISAGSLNLYGGLHNLGRSTGARAASTGVLNISGTGSVVVGSASDLGGKLILGNRDTGATNNGTGTINQTGGTLTISAGSSLYLSAYGNGRYDLLGGTLQVGGTNGLLARYAGSGTYAFNLGGGTIQVIGSALTTAVAATLVEDTTSTIDTNGFAATLSGVLSGAGALAKSGAGTLTLSGTNTYSGGTTIAAGTLQIGADANLGNTDSAVILEGGTLKTTQSFTSSRRYEFAEDGVFDVATGTTLTLTGVLEGDGALVLTGAGTVVIDQETNYWGGTVLSGGTLVVSDHLNLGEDSGAITFDGGTLHAAESFSTGRSVLLTGAGTISTGFAKALTLSGTISGTGGLTMAGPGTLVLSGTNTYTGDTTVSAGTLDLTGSLAGSVQVAGGGTLKGSGEIAGTVTVAEDATLFGVQGSGLTMGALVLQSGSNLDVSLGATSAGGVFTVEGDLTLDGTLRVNQLTDFGAGVYTIINYGGTLTDNGLDVASLDNGYLNGLQTTQAGEVNLVVQAGDATIQFWNGGNSSPTAGVLGGSGTWKLEDNNWTDATGTIPQAWTSGFAVFQGTGGVVTVDNGNGDVTTTGMQFATTPYTAGYLMTGGAITLTGDATIRVGDGTADGASISAKLETVIAGEAGLTKTDLGMLELTAVNTYTGGTTISGGTLFVYADSNLGDASGGITLNGGMLQSATSFTSARSVTLIGTGKLAADDGRALTLSGVVSGTGALEVASVGDVILTGDNSYSGGTIVSFGKLKVGKDEALGDAEGGLTIHQGTLVATATFTSERDVSLTGNAKIETESGATLTLSGVISSGSIDGKLTKTGTGTLILSGENTYTGTTTISAGTLQVGADTALGFSTAGLSIGAGTLATTGTFTTSRTVSLTAAATIDTEEDTSLIVSGVISGSGGLTKAGAGTLILTANNSYTGTTTISAGTLQIGNGGTTGSIVGDIVNNASLVFNRSDAYTIAGSITGSGTLTLSGGGTATFASSVSADVTLEDAAAVLALDSVTAADFIVGDGGVLGGSATIGSLTVNNGGTVAPGYSPGTLTVDGPVAFNAGSTYSVDVTPDGSHDLIIASGDVTLSSDAFVEVVASGGVYDRTSRLTILTTTATLTGEFGGVTSNFAFLLPSLDYDDNNVYLDLVYDGTSIDTYAGTPNQVSVAHAIQTLGDGNDIFDAITLLAEDAVAPALDQLSGEIYPSINTVISQQGSYLRDAVGDRLRQSGAGALGAAALAAGPETSAIADQPGTFIWAQGYGAFSQTLGNGNAATISSALGGLLAGVDAQISDTLRAGIVTGYGAAQFDVDARGSSGTMTTAEIGAYVGAQFEALGLQGGISYGWNDIDVTRSIVFPGFADDQSASYGVGALQIFGEASYRLAFAGYEVEPFANLAYVNLSGGSARETGLGAAGLSIDVAGQEMLATTIGTRLATTIELDDASLTPSLTVGWQHVFGDTATTATMQSGATPFSVEGVPVASDMLVLGAGLSYGLSDALSLEVNYAGKIAQGVSQNAFTARLSGSF